ncbi:MAG TPA: dienelactone hydrolase family protein [Blastocatellia bacterium]|nr:dienelactone hydrolase family protein [Blastocatellia bacterium]
MRKQNGDYSDLLEIQARIPAGDAVLDGDLMIPSGASGIAVFAHGSGSSRHSPRNRSVASVIRESGVGTLLFDLLTREEESVDVFTRRLRFDIDLLTARLVEATRWLAGQEETRDLWIGYFGSSTGAAAALMAAAGLGEEIGAVVSRGGRPDLAGDALPLVKAPTLLIVGGHDETVIELNQDAYARLRCERELRVIPGATHLFEEPGALEQVADLAAAWFKEHLQSLPAQRRAAGGGHE